MNLANNPTIETSNLLSIGHGGTYLGNLIVVPSNWNVTKSAINPFEWCDECLNSQDKGLYMTKVADLARLNNMTLDEYKEFIFWCFDNPRTIDELQKELEDNGSIVDSINLFRKKPKLERMNNDGANNRRKGSTIQRDT